jgi:hypothetical protein
VATGGGIWTGHQGYGERADRRSAHKDFNELFFIIFLGIVEAFMFAALDGAGGKLQGFGCQVWVANLYLQAHSALSLQPMSKAAGTDGR